MGEAKWKYFQHAGALLTADGSDDDLIKFEGAPAGNKKWSSQVLKYSSALHVSADWSLNSLLAVNVVKSLS